ncbi:transketolase family protein [Parasphingorhabdus sp.]|uniref:transketolase family protein n=1 Tax=Parasphingorhabdus sp. TaxID=2709688 RepID=UPI003A8F8898
MRDAFIRALTDLAEVDPSIVLITGDLGFGVLTDFADRFPSQYINAGVAEQNMTAIACGMALEGYKTYTYSIANFPTLRCLEQIRNDICYHDANVTIVSVGAGFSYGSLGMSHFATEDLAIMRALPNMEVVAPADPWEAAELTRQMADRPGPKYLRIDKGCAGLPDDTGSLQLGRHRVVGEGKDITIVTIGAIAHEALVAQKRLAETGIASSVVILNCLKPLDESAIAATLSSSRVILTLEEHNIVGGLGSAIADICLEHDVRPAKFAKIGLKDIYPSVVGDQEFLRNEYKMSADHVFKIAQDNVQSG